eukprot:6624854-Karenia_brevis.AAC.1
MFGQTKPCNQFRCVEFVAKVVLLCGATRPPRSCKCESVKLKALANILSTGLPALSQSEERVNMRSSANVR